MVIGRFKKVDLPVGYSIDDVIKYIRDEQQKGNLKGYGDVVSMNGLEGESGFGMLAALRGAIEQHTLGAQMVVVRTHELKVRFAGIGQLGVIDLVRFRKSHGGTAKVEYWYEYGEKRFASPVVDRKSIMAFEASAYPIEEVDGLVGELKLIVPCLVSEYEKTTKLLEEADSVIISGMMIDVGSGVNKNVVNNFIVQDFKIVEHDFSIANDVLGKLSDWHQLIPMRHFETREPLFPEDTSLAMMASVLFTRKGVPAFNTIFFGSSGGGKTAALRFFVEEIMGGSIESATASSGKGWLVSHKEGAPPSKMFSEKKVLLVDEMLKSVSTNQRMNAHSYAVELKAFLHKHLQILDREEVSASSGVGLVRGRMVCAFIGTENDDDSLMKALGRAEVMSEAPVRRIQIGYADRKVNSDEDVNPVLAKSRQMKEFCEFFGKNARMAIRNLYLYSRKFTEDTSLEAPVEWKRKMKGRLRSEMEMSLEGYPRWYKVGCFDEVTAKRLQMKFNDFLQLHTKGILTPCYVSAAVFRGWEACKSLEELKPVFDDRQLEMAEMLVLYFFKSKLKVLSSGIEAAFAPEGVQRLQLFGGVL